MDNVDFTPTDSDRKFFHTFQLSGTSFLDAFCMDAKTLFDANAVFIASLGLVESKHLSSKQSALIS